MVIAFVRMKNVLENYGFMVRRKSLCLSQVTHQAGAYPGICSIKRLALLLIPLDGMLIHRRATSRTYTKHGPWSMDHPRGPGPWTTLWACGPGPWTTSWTPCMDHSRGPGPWTTPGPDFHLACSCTIYVGSTVLSTVGLCTLADHNLPMSNEIPTAVGQNVWTTFFFAFECKHQCSALTTH